MSFIDISSRLGKVRSRIYRVGIELEGAWTDPKQFGSIHRDGSVRFPELNLGGEDDPPPTRLLTAQEQAEMAARRAAIRIGEIPSPQLVEALPKKPLSNMAPPLDFRTWLKQWYPPHVNQTCGMHVHMSFRNALLYQRLMDEAYMETIVEFISRWSKVNLPSDHHIWPRLKGESRYCQHKFMADKQASVAQKDFDQTRDGHRYTVVNYAFSRTGTVEVRLLPMMPNVDLAISAVQEILNITSAFLVCTAKREIPQEFSWAVVETSHKEDLIECV